MLEQAIARDPEYAKAHALLARLQLRQVYNGFGTAEQLIPRVRAAAARAQALDPLSRIINANLGLHYYYARQYDQVIEQLRKTIDLNPDFGLAYFYMGRPLLQKGMHKEAIVYLQKGRDLSGDDPETL